MKVVVLLDKHHQRNAFDCGDDALNQYLKKIARQHQDKGLSRTYVLVDHAQSDIILAYMTLTVCEITTEYLPEKWANKLPKRIPAAKLARLAVGKHYQKLGYGQYLLIDAIQKTLDVHRITGLVGLLVDAKHAQARDYYMQFGFLAAPEQLDNLFLPISTITL